MTITYLFKVAVPSDQSIQQYKETLEKRLSTLKPRRLNKFHVQTIVFQSATNQNYVHQYLHSDYPTTCFVVMEPSGAAPGSSSSVDARVLTGDIGLMSVQRRICELGTLNERKQLQTECVGSGFKIGDFQIKLGAVTHNSSNRGLLIEIAYASASTNSDAYGVISEFVLSLFGWTNPSEMMTGLVRRKAQNLPFTPEDTIVQYFEHFNTFRNVAPAISSTSTAGTPHIIK